MKKLIFTLFIGLALFIASCNDEIAVPKEDIHSTEQIASSNRTVVEAACLAEERASLLYPNHGRNNSRTVDLNDVQCIKSKPSRSGMTDTLMYVLNFNDNQGFAIVSAPRNAIDVLAVVEEGYYDAQRATENPGFQYYLEAAMEYCQQKTEEDSIISTLPSNLYASNIDVKPGIEIRLDTIVDSYALANKIGLEWGQQGIYGAYCPNGISGCSPIAMAQVITSCNVAKPRPHISYNFPEADLSSEEIDWYQIRKHIRGNSYSISNECYEANPTEVHKTIGRLIRQLGYDSEAEYLKNSTSVMSSKIRGVLQKHLPDLTISKFKKYNVAQAQRDIDKGPIIMVASASKEETKTGHAWVVDAYHWISHTQEFRTIDPNTMKWSPWMTWNKQEHYNHFVWGWNGYLDGYFEGTVIECNGYTFEDLKYIAINKYN